MRPLNYCIYSPNVNQNSWLRQWDLVVDDVVGAVWKGPAENGAVGADADDMTFVWTDLDTGDGCTVTQTNVRHRPLLVQPYLHTCPQLNLHDQ